MTPVPLPDTPCIRTQLIGDPGSGWEWGNRFFHSYAGSAPSGSDCASIASDIAAAWATNIAPLVFGGFHLEEIDVLDIATDSGHSGQWHGSEAGSNSGSAIPVQCAVGVEYDIGRRYRGGKPRMYLLAGVDSDLVAVNAWSSGFIGNVNTGVAAFFAAIAAISVGSVGALQHVNLSYYQGFDNVMNSSGRERAVPRYRPVALHDNVVGYAAKSIVSSQRRRRTSSSP